MTPFGPARAASGFRIAVLVVALLVTMAATTAAVAQEPNLPPQWFPERAPTVEGEALSFCVDPRQPGYEFHRALAQAIGDVLLLEIVLVDVDREFVVEAEYDHLYVDLVDQCTAYMGFKLYAGAYPNWLIFTRAFYESRFVVLTHSDGPERLEDFQAGAAIGAVQGSMGDVRFLTYNNSRPAADRWRRLPLGMPQRALSALAGGTVEALVIWEPWWHELREQEPAFGAFEVVRAPIVSEPWIPVGAALVADRSAAQFLIDQAIAELHANGTVAALLEEHAFPGRPVAP